MNVGIDCVCIDPALDVVWVPDITIADDPDVRGKQFAQEFDFSFDLDGGDAVNADETGFTELGYSISDILSTHYDTWLIRLLHAKTDTPSAWS